jgi:hypothetical protein
MSDLERSLNRVLQQHQQESGLHMIGGRQRLLDRLVEFFEEEQHREERQKSEQEH